MHHKRIHKSFWNIICILACMLIVLKWFMFHVHISCGHSDPPHRSKTVAFTYSDDDVRCVYIIRYATFLPLRPPQAPCSPGCKAHVHVARRTLHVQNDKSFDIYFFFSHARQFWMHTSQSQKETILAFIP